MSSTNGSKDPVESFVSIVNIFRREEAHTLRELAIDEINNHINIRSLSGSNTGRMDESDMNLILDRWGLLIRTIRLFQGGRGPEDYAPKAREAGTAAVESALAAMKHESA